MREMITVRAAALDDAVQLALLCEELGVALPAAIASQRLQAMLASSSSQVVVAQNGERVVGWAAAQLRLTLQSGTRVEVTGLAVDPGSRRQGVGRVLLAAIERWAQSRGHSVVLARSNATRVESHPFFESLGYERSKTQQVYRKPLPGVRSTEKGPPTDGG